MGAKRILIGVALVGLIGERALGQTGADGLFPPAASAPSDSPLAPVAGTEAGPSMLSSGIMAAPPPPYTPTDTLTDTRSYPGSTLPPGSYPSPWCGGHPVGCAGPWGANGPMGYELYSNTGVSFPFTGGNMIGSLKAGVMTGGGGRSLLFDATGTRAWAIDLGVTYTHNAGNNVRVLQVFTPQPTNPATGELLGPDQVNSFYLRALHRTSFNFAIGRDWWLNGPGFVSETSGTNWRVGAEVGGRYGTAHVDLIPVGDRFNYFRRHSVFNGLFLGGKVECEVPMGAWALFGGVHGQWGYDWMNIIPPMDGDVQSFNVLLTLGVRF